MNGYTDQNGSISNFRSSIVHKESDGSDDSSCKEDALSNCSSRAATPQPREGKKTRGRVKINMEFIENKLRRYTTFSKRKSGIMKKAHELATLTGTQVMLLVASETGHVYTFATRKLTPMLSTERGKQLIQTCLSSPDPFEAGTSNNHNNEQRMSAQGFEDSDLNFEPPVDSKNEPGLNLVQRKGNGNEANKQHQEQQPFMFSKPNMFCQKPESPVASSQLSVSPPGHHSQHNHHQMTVTSIDNNSSVKIGSRNLQSVDEPASIITHSTLQQHILSVSEESHQLATAAQFGVSDGNLLEGKKMIDRVNTFTKLKRSGSNPQAALNYSQLGPIQPSSLDTATPTSLKRVKR